jgi:hypothetical protein
MNILQEKLSGSEVKDQDHFTTISRVMGKSEKEQRKTYRGKSAIDLRVYLLVACLSPVHGGFQQDFISPPVIEAVVYEAWQR